MHEKIANINRRAVVSVRQIAHVAFKAESISGDSTDLWIPRAFYKIMVTGTRYQVVYG